jgi:hypothetical protein
MASMKESGGLHSAFRSAQDTGCDLVLTKRDLPWIPGEQTTVRLVDAELINGERVLLGSAVRGDELQALTTEVGDTVPNNQFYAGVTRVVTNERGVEIVGKTDGSHVIYKVNTRNNRAREDGDRRKSTTYFVAIDGQDVPTYVKVASAKINKSSRVKRILGVD